jgi:putative transposase
LEAWAFHRSVRLDFTRLGKPTDNSHVESFNRRLRDECRNVHQVTSLADARAKLEAWWVDYNQQRPHGSVGHSAPSESVTPWVSTNGSLKRPNSNFEPSRFGTNVP